MNILEILKHLRDDLKAWTTHNLNVLNDKIGEEPVSSQINNAIAAEINNKFGNVENKSSATIRGELTKENVTSALGYTPPMINTTYEAITNDEIDEICGGTLTTFLENISSERMSF